MDDRQAYYAAVRELGVCRDVLQTQIGFFFAAVQEMRRHLEEAAPNKLSRFDEAVVLARRQLCNDITGKVPSE